MQKGGRTVAEIELIVSKDKFTVHLNVINDTLPLDFEEIDVYSLLSKQGISFGIKRDVISKMISDPETSLFPLLVAEGEAPTKGKDGFIKLESGEKKHDRHSPDILNFRNVRKIPSVRAGQLIATVYPNKPGNPGRNVLGQPIQATSGKPYSLKLGKNVVETNGKIYATIDGQISLSGKKMSVLPVFEVNGDLNLKTGNIDFIGNVTINGNVPSDYRIKAGGNILVYGIVEGAHLDAGGSIYISGGIAGFTKAKVHAEGDIIASYLNQCQVYAGNNIEVTGLILHSICDAKGDVRSMSSIIGGQIVAGNHVYSKDIGNTLHTKTEIHIRESNHPNEEEKRLRMEIETIKAQLQKVYLILQKLTEKYKRTSTLSEDEILLLRRDKLTQTELTKKLAELESELDTTTIKQQEAITTSITATGGLYPNVHVQFGKYQRIINQQFRSVIVQLLNKEITIYNLS